MAVWMGCTETGDPFHSVDLVSLKSGDQTQTTAVYTELLNVGHQTHRFNPKWFLSCSVRLHCSLFCLQDPPTCHSCWCLWPFCIWSPWPCFSLPLWRRLVVMHLHKHHFRESRLTHSYWNKEASAQWANAVQRSCMFICQNVFRFVGCIILPNIYQVKLKHFYLHFSPMVLFCLIKSLLYTFVWLYTSIFVFYCCFLFWPEASLSKKAIQMFFICCILFLLI